MEKLADGLQKLNEDDLLHVVTLIHDNKSNETYTKNDVESESPISLLCVPPSIRMATQPVSTMLTSS